MIYPHTPQNRTSINHHLSSLLSSVNCQLSSIIYHLFCHPSSLPSPSTYRLQHIILRYNMEQPAFILSQHSTIFFVDEHT